MKRIIIIIFLIFIGCSESTKTTRDSNYYPGEYRPELNVGNNSFITVESSLKSGDSTIALISLKDTKDNPILVGGSNIKLFQKNGIGSVLIDPTIDNNDGTYSVKISGLKKGSVNLCISSHSKSINVCKEILIQVGDISLTKSNLFISRSNFLLNETAEVSLTLKDINENNIDNSTLSLHPSVIGTSQGTISGFSYLSGKYISTFTANQEGTESELNVSISGIGIVKSKIPINVMATKPIYTNSTISISSSQIKVNQTTQITVSIKDTSKNILNIDNLPIILESSEGNSVISFGTILKNGSAYTATLTGISSGTILKIKAKVDGEYILSSGEVSLQVVP